MNFEKAVEFVIALEGGYILHKNKTEEAETYAGIYRKANPTWEGWKYIDSGKDIPRELVYSFYKTIWDKIDCKNMYIKFLIFEFGVNAGIETAKKIAKSIRNDYASLENTNEVREFILEFTLMRIRRYLEICNKNPKQYGIYLRGWLNRTFSVLEANI